MPKKFTDFQLKTELTEYDYFVGINSDQNSEFKTQAMSLTAYIDNFKKISGPYTTVNQNSATTWNYQGTDIKALTGDYSSSYTTVNQNSATTWNNDIVTKYADSNFIPISGGYIKGNLFVTSSVNISGSCIIQNDLIIGTALDTTLFVEDKKIGINTEIPNHALTVVGSISSTENVIFSNLPNSSSGLPKGSIYIDSGFLKIVL